MPEQASFGESIVLNLQRQKKILQEKIDQIDKICALVEDNAEVVEFAQLMQQYQQQPQPLQQ